MEKEREKGKKWIKIFLVFLAFMWLCTIISKSIYVAGLPRVNVQTTEKKYVEHIIEADGIVIAGGEQAVNTVSGLRVQNIKVQEGDSVEKGDVLFRIDLEDLASIISEKETELTKLKYHLADTQFNEVLDSQKKELAILWAQEDYENADRETALVVERAELDWQNARNELDEHMKTEVPYTSDSSRESAWNAYNDWKRRGYELSDKITAKEREIKNIEDRLNQLGISSFAEVEGQEVPQEKNESQITDKADEAKKETEGVEKIEEIEDIKETEEAKDVTEETELLESEKRIDETKTLSGAVEPNSQNVFNNTEEQAELEQTLKQANDELIALKDQLVKHERETVKEPNFSEEELAYDSWQQKKSALEDSVEAARRVFEDALYARNNTLMQKKRDLANAEANNASDSTASIYELEIANLQAEIDKFYALKKQNGEIKAEKNGFISKIQIQVGSRTVDSAAILLTDAEAPCQFRFSITKEQSKYMQLGDSFELKINNKSSNKLEATVDYLTENTSGGYDIICRLPENIGQPGASGSVRKSVQGEFHNMTIPIEALHKENEAYYIYTYNEKAGILGKEAYAEKLKVQILDQNDRYAALEPGTISADTQIITFSSEELKQGQSIRMAE